MVNVLQNCLRRLHPVYKMKLEQIANDPLGTFIHLERYCHFYNYPDLIRLGDFKPEYSSFASDKPVNLAMLRLPKCNVEVSLTDLSSNVLKRFIQEDEVYFPVHPQVLEEKNCLVVNDACQKAIDIGQLESQPTASVRTLFVNDENPFFIKVHFPRRISSLTREITAEDIAIGRWFTDEFKRASDSGELPTDMGFYPELLGVCYRSGENSAGAIIRDFNTYPKMPNSYSVPLSALFSRDVKSPDERPLLFSLAEVNHNNPEDYLIDEIITPHMRQWAWLAFDFGVIFNSHGQNVVLQFDSNWKVRRFDYRDFQGRLVVPEIRAKNRLSLPCSLLRREQNMDFATEISVSYDFMLGDRLYDRLLEPLKEAGYMTKPLVQKIRDLFTHIVGDNAHFFRKSRIYYQGITTDRRQVDIGKPPKYR